MSKHYISILFFLICSATQIGQAQCLQEIKITITTLNFSAGCPFGDNGGMDPVIEVFGPSGNQIYIMYLNNLDQVNGPVQNEVVDFSASGHPNFCPGGGYTDWFELGEFPLSQSSVTVPVEIYEKNSNFFNGECDGHSQFLDSEFGSGGHTFDFSQTTGTIDVGSCISFNYELEIRYKGQVSESISGPICPTDTLLVNGKKFYKNNSIGTEVLPGVNSCDTLLNIDLQFHRLPAVRKFGEGNFCPGGLLSIGVNDEFDIYQWDTGQSSESILVEEPGTYSLTVTTSNGCILEESFTIDTFAVTQAMITGPEDFCEGESILLELNTGGTIEWEDGTTEINRMVDATGVYSVTITDSNGCPSEAEKSVTQNPKPTMTWIGDTNLCEGNTTTIGVTENYITYLWDDGDDSKERDINSPGTYQLTVTDDNGCTSESMLTLMVFPSPDPLILGTDEICLGETIMLTLDDTYDSYLWTDNSENQILEVTEPGSYGVTVTNSAGCTGTSVFLVNTASTAVPDITGDLVICPGSTGMLSIDPSFGLPKWNDGSQVQDLVVTTAGEYSVTVTDTNGCMSSTAVMVSEFSVTTPNIIGDLMICPGRSTTLNLDQAYDNYLWSDGSNAAEISVQQAGSIAVTVTDSNGCSSSSSVLVQAEDFGGISVSLDDMLLAGQSYDLQVMGPLPDDAVYSWSSNDDLLCTPNCSEITVTPDTTTTYIFELSLNGCTYTAATILFVSGKLPEPIVPDTIYYPNIFSPELADQNSTFRIESSQVGVMEIYDRWGNLIHTGDTVTGWSGNINGSSAASGVYVYRITFPSIPGGPTSPASVGEILLIR